MKNNGIYYTNRHSCFLLQYHLVLVTKYRRHVMVDALRDRMRALIAEYFARWGLPVMEYEVCSDHIHILFEAKPNMNLTDFINGLKTFTSRKVRQEFEDFLAQFYWKPLFWSDSYFIASVSDRSATAVKHYIATQDIS